MNSPSNQITPSVFIDSFARLRTYCEAQDYAGWDPYDGLNSKLFQAMPFKKWPLARLAMIHLLKRSPINFRPMAMVPKGENPKALGLFLSAYARLYRAEGRPEDLEKIHDLAQRLIALKTEGYHGACWGYNFDWQARGGLFFPKYTPTVVATTFAAYGLFDAYEITKEEEWLDLAISSAQFVAKDLTRTPKKEGFLFSYAPLKGNKTVYNASLLGSKLLSKVYAYSGEQELIDLAEGSVLACCKAQREDGAWIYGELPIQSWMDSFHTGYNLEAIAEFQRYSKSQTYQEYIDKGMAFYLDNFFTQEGIPKYYNNNTYPIDVHCPAQFFVTLVRLEQWENHQATLDKVLHWTIENMQDKAGYFYFQKSKYWLNKTPYMRWCQAWMFYGMSFYLCALKGVTP